MTDTDGRRERWESAIREQHNGLWPAEVSAIAATTRAMADAEQREAEEKRQAFLQHADQVNNDLMKEVQRYAEGEETPVLWSVYNGMHKRALTAEAQNGRLRTELGSSERIRENADFHLGQEMARRQLAERENARLRAELDDALADLSTEQRRKEDALATIQRVRALAADMRTWCSHRGIATVCAQDIDDALDGPEAGQ